jgi:hypothetical protein
VVTSDGGGDQKWKVTREWRERKRENEATMESQRVILWWIWACLVIGREREWSLEVDVEKREIVL